MMTDSKPQGPELQASDRYSRIAHWSIVIGILAAGLVMRLVPIGRYVTPDEPAWVYRSIQFADALAAHDWASLPSTGHPGVTTMWLGAAGVAAQRLMEPAESAVHLDWIRRLAWLAPGNGEAFRHLDFFLPSGRIAVALATTLGLVILYPLLVQLFDRRAALMTIGLLAFDPFLIGHSGLLHTDGLLATLSLLALTTALRGLRQPRHAVWWALSGIFTGLAMLTKTPAIFLLPCILLSRCLILDSRFSIRHPSSIVIAHCLVFILSTFLTCFALYPALWTDPGGTLNTLSAFSGRHIEMVQRPIFFAGQMRYDAGAFFYPVVFLFRISPVVIGGLVIGLAKLHRLPSDRRLAFLVPLAFAVGFGALMSLGAKKHDRYLLPAFPPLILAASLGIDQYIGKLKEPINQQSTNLPIYHFITIAFQALLAIVFIPYPLTYANPLAGGPWVAAHMLPVDWGEGMGAAARWLNEMQNPEQLTVAAISVPSFASRFKGRTLPRDQATLADYLVLGTSQQTGRPSTQATDQPTYIVRLSFLKHATVFRNTAPLEQATYLTAHAGSDDLIVLNADSPLQHHYTGPAKLATASGSPDQATTTARIRELGADRSTIWLVEDPAAAPITARHLRQGLETIATPAHTATVASSKITQYRLHSDVVHNNVIRDTRYANFNDQLVLVDTLLPATPVNAPFPAFLRWQVPASTPTNLHASLTLRDSDGHLWAEVGEPVLNKVDFPTSAWIPGEWADSTMKPKLPGRIVPGTYVVQLTVTDAYGAQLGAWDAGGTFQGVRLPLGSVEVVPPAEPAGSAPCAEDRTLTAGPFTACISDPPPQTIPSGDTLTLALTWSSLTAPEADYRIRWRLSRSADPAALEQTTDLCTYATSRWRAGDSFEIRYDLRINPALQAGRYQLTLNVLTPDGRPVWTEDKELFGIEITSRDRLFELPADISHALDLTLGATIHLRGFDLSAVSAEGKTRAVIVQPGDTLPLTLYWQADGPTELNYTVFAHLVGPDGRLHGQSDRFPAGGRAPTTSWAPGQVVVDEIPLSVVADAPAGSYHIAVGMYEATSGGRLPITDASGQAVPNDQAVLPVEITVTGSGL